MIKYENLRSRIRCQRIRSTSCGQAVATLAFEAGVRTLGAESALSCQPAKIQLKTIVGAKTEVPVIQDVGGEERSFSDALGSLDHDSQMLKVQMVTC